MKRYRHKTKSFFKLIEQHCWGGSLWKVIIKQIYHHHHHHVVPPVRISQTFSRHFSLSFILYPHRSAVCMFELDVLLLLGHMSGSYVIYKLSFCKSYILFIHHHHDHEVPPARISLTLSWHSPYHSSPPAGLQGYTPYPHRAALCIFELVVLLLLGHKSRSIGVHHSWARPCFSSSVLHVWFV